MDFAETDQFMPVAGGDKNTIESVNGRTGKKTRRDLIRQKAASPNRFLSFLEHNKLDRDFWLIEYWYRDIWLSYISHHCNKHFIPGDFVGLVTNFIGRTNTGNAELCSNSRLTEKMQR